MAEVFTAIGDPTRQQIIFTMFDLPCQNEGGARVGVITEKTHLSRPAVSHHLKILKDVGIVGMRREVTRNYYYLEANQEALIQLRHLIDLTAQKNKGE